MNSMRPVAAHPDHAAARWIGRRLQLAAAVALCLTMPLAVALDRGTSPAGVVYASGGGSYEELDAMRAEQPHYSFWLTTAVRGSGAYLAGVKVRIADDTGRRVLEHTMDGPWLFADLPLGRFEVEAFILDERTGRLEIQRGSVGIHRGDHHQMVLYFGTTDDVGEDRRAAEGRTK
jgi:hypothetical protein